MTRSLRRAPIFLALLLPVVAFLVIGRTVEIKRGLGEGRPPLRAEQDVVSATIDLLGPPRKRRFGLAGGSSAGAGLSVS